MVSDLTQLRAVPPPPPSGVKQAPDPEEAVILGRVEAARRKIALVELSWRVLILLAGAIALAIVAAIVDQWVFPRGMPGLWRWILWGSFLFAEVGWAAYAILPYFIRRIHPVFAAYVMEQAIPDLRHSLMSFVMLRREKETFDSDPLRKNVFRGLESVTARQVADVSPDLIIDKSQVIRAGFVLAALVALFSALIIFSPKNSLTSAARVFLPWSGLPPPTRVKIEDVRPGDATILQGDRVIVSSRVRGLRPDEEVRVLYSTADGQAVDQIIPMTRTSKDDDKFTCELTPALQQATVYRIVAGDAETRLFRLDAVVPLRISVKKIEYQYPAYTGLEPKVTEDLGDIQAVEGTRVTIYAESQSPLQTSELVIEGAQAAKVPMIVKGNQAVGRLTLRLKRPDELQREFSSYYLHAASSDGRPSLRPVKHTIEVIPDKLPVGTWLDPKEEQIDLPVNATTTLRFRAEDPDFGLKKVDLRLTVPGSDPVRIALLEKGPQERHLGEFLGEHVFVAADYHLAPGDLVLVNVSLVDNREPNAHRVELPLRRIRIVSPDAASAQSSSGADTPRSQANSESQPSKPPLDRQNSQNPLPPDEGTPPPSQPNSESSPPPEKPEKEDQQNQQSPKRTEVPPNAESTDKPESGDTSASKPDVSKPAPNQSQADQNPPQGEPKSQVQSETKSHPKSGPESQQSTTVPKNSGQASNSGQTSGSQGKEQGMQDATIAPSTPKTNDGSSQPSSEKTSEEQANDGSTSQTPQEPGQDKGQQATPSSSGQQVRQPQEGSSASDQQEPGSPQARQQSRPQSGDSSDSSTGAQEPGQTQPRAGQNAASQAANQSSNDAKSPQQSQGQSVAAGDSQTAANQGDVQERDSAAQQTNNGQSAAQSPAGENAGKEGSERERKEGKSQAASDRPEPNGGQSGRPEQAASERTASNNAPTQGGQQNSDKQGAQQPSAGSQSEKGNGERQNTSGGQPREAASDANKQCNGGSCGNGQKVDGQTNPGDAIERILSYLEKKGIDPSQLSQQPPTPGPKTPQDSASQCAGSCTSGGNGQQNGGAQPSGGGQQAGGQSSQSAPSGEPQKSPSGGAGEKQAADGTPQDSQAAQGSSGAQQSGAQQREGTPPTSATPMQTTPPEGAKSSDNASERTSSEPQSAGQPDRPGQESSKRTEGVAGDQAGPGEQGGGRQTPQPGEGTPGTQSPADANSGAAARSPGGPETGSRSANQGEASTASGSASQAGSSASQTGQSSEGQGQSQEVTQRRPGQGGAPQGGGVPGSSLGPGGAWQTRDTPVDDPNLEFARRQTELVLGYLEDQLAKQNPDQEMLDQLGWSRQDAAEFLQRWQEMKKLAQEPTPQGQQARRQLNELLKSLGLKPKTTELTGSSQHEDELQGLEAGRDVPPPPQWREYFQEYLKSLGGTQ